MLALRKFISQTRSIIPGFRALSTSRDLVDISVDDDGIATVTMQRLPVNSLNLDLIQDLTNALDEVERNKYKGMVLASASPKVFCAGLDINEVYKPDIKRCGIFWTALQDLWIRLYSSNFITAAAVNGHAPAAGCLLALACEYRAMGTGNFTMGYNEVLLGLVVVPWFIHTMATTIPRRQAEVAITSGQMFTADEALKVGLIDATATDKADCIEKCKQFIKKFDRTPPLARAVTKQKIRAEPLAWMHKNQSHDTEEFLANLVMPEVQQALEVYINNLKKRNANKDKK